VEEAAVEQTEVEEAAVEQAVVEQSVVAQSVVEEAVVEEAVVEQTVVEEAAVAQSVVEQSAVAQSVVAETAIVVETAVESDSGCDVVGDEQLKVSTPHVPSLLDMSDPDEPNDPDLVAYILDGAFGYSRARTEQLWREMKMTNDHYISKLIRLKASNVLQMKRDELQERLQFVKQVRPPGLDDPSGVDLIDVPSTASYLHSPSVKWWLMFNLSGTDHQQFCELHFKDDADEFFVTSVDDRQAGGVRPYIHVRRAGQPYPILSNLHQFHSVVFLLRVGSEPKLLIRDISHNKFTACVYHTDGTYVTLCGVPSVWRDRKTNKEMFDRAELALLNRHWRAPVILSHGCELKYMQSPLYSSTFHRNTRPLQIFFLDDSSCRVESSMDTSVTFNVVTDDGGVASDTKTVRGTVIQPNNSMMRDSLPPKLVDPRLMSHSGSLVERYAQFSDAHYKAANLSVEAILPSIGNVMESDIKIVHAGLYRSATNSRTAQRVKAMHDSVMVSCSDFFFLLAFRHNFEEQHRSMFAALSLSMSLNTGKRDDETSVSSLMQVAHEWLAAVNDDSDFVFDTFPVYRNSAYVEKTVCDLYCEGVLVEMDPHGGWNKPHEQYGDNRRRAAHAMFLDTVKAFSFTGNLACIDAHGVIVEMTAGAKRAMLELILVALVDHLEIVITLVMIGDNGLAQLVTFKEGCGGDTDAPAPAEFRLVYDSGEFLVFCDRSNVDGKYFQ
jgi:hypothetical protein